ncbi:hypothetical protein SBV1_890042 [Verrucomicrobia bacterium]|nr:hypothetical protein SBV1_890042 [Verrucomicrobiota bacterium]
MLLLMWGFMDFMGIVPEGRTPLEARGRQMRQTSRPERQEMKHLLGFDIGGTKCAVIVGRAEGQNIRIARRVAFPTPSGPEAALSIYTSP